MRIVAWLLVALLFGLSVLGFVGHARWTTQLASPEAQRLRGLAAAVSYMPGGAQAAARAVGILGQMRDNAEFCLWFGFGSGGLAILCTVILAATHRRREAVSDDDDDGDEWDDLRHELDNLRPTRRSIADRLVPRSRRWR
jgi:hypothetical protein